MNIWGDDEPESVKLPGGDPEIVARDEIQAATRAVQCGQWWPVEGEVYAAGSLLRRLTRGDPFEGIAERVRRSRGELADTLRAPDMLTLMTRDANDRDDDGVPHGDVRWPYLFRAVRATYRLTEHAECAAYGDADRLYQCTDRQLGFLRELLAALHPGEHEP